MVDDVAEKVGTCQSPAAARAVRADEKRALARSDEQRDRARSGTRGSIRGFGLRHREALLDFQSFDPALVQLRGDRVERMHALVEPLEHLLRGLHRRPGLRYELLFPVFAPGTDQLARHLDVALHAEVLAERERLVRAIRTPGDARRLRRDGEGFAVPVKTGERSRIRGNLLPCVDLDEPVRNAVRVEECGKIARPLGAAMAKNRNRFHVRDEAIVFKLRIVASLLFLSSAAGWTAEVSVIGLFPGKAVVVIDGGAPRVLSVGQKPVEGVSLISTDRESATLLIDGEKRTLRIGQHQSGPAPASSSQSATLTADARGHFVVDGQINGGAVRFLVDTGATSISLSSADASRLGIDYRKGQPGLMGTANGTVAAYRVKLDTVRIGDIVVNNVDAAVLEGNQMPFALLGMSFLNRMEMKRDGQTMMLIRRF